MVKTKIKKGIALVAITLISATGLSNLNADKQIGTGSVSGTSSFNTPIIWNETYTANSASWTITWITVSANVEPTLSIEFSTWTLALWTLVPWVEKTASLNIEVWTNAANWVNLNVKSSSGWLTNTLDNSIQINNLTSDWSAESYKFVSAINASTDSTIAWFTQSANLDTEVNNTSTSHNVYTSNKPQLSNWVNDISFTVKATANAQTTAWNYQDTINFIVSANF